MVCDVRSANSLWRRRGVPYKGYNAVLVHRQQAQRRQNAIQYQQKLISRNSERAKPLIIGTAHAMTSA